MNNRALFADYYEFTMLRAYFESKMTKEATFSLFVRKLPPQRNFLIACGLAVLLDEIEALRFTDEQIKFLGSLGDFPAPFLNWLREFRFAGDIYAMAEGTPFFDNEPILEVTAPIAEAQFLETLILNQIGLQTILASKAAGIVAAARGRFVSDFGARRAHGFDAAIKGARACFAPRGENLRGVPLLQPVMLGGRRVAHDDRSLKDIRRHRKEALAILPEKYLQLITLAELYPVEISAEATRLELNTRNALERREIGSK